MLKQELDLSKEVLWVSVGQRITKLQSVKVGGLKNILPLSQSRTKTQAGQVRDRELCQVATLKPFDLQKPRKPLRKDLTPVVIVVSAQ